MRITILAAALALLLAGGGASARAGQGAPATATPGRALDMVLVPTFWGTDASAKQLMAGRFGKPFDPTRDGAEQAATELRDPTPLRYVLSPGGAAQIAVVTDATARGVGAIMLSNNSGAAIVPAAKAARAKGITLVSWAYPIPSADGQDVFVAQDDATQGGAVLAGMARTILGPAGGKLAVLSNAPDAPPSIWVTAFEAILKQPPYATLEPVDLVYGNDDPARSYEQALALIDRHPDLKLIVGATSNSALAAVKAVQDRHLCGRLKVTGFGIPSNMRDYVLDGCAPEIALWSYTDLGYLAYYTAYLLATGALKAEPGRQFTAGRLGIRTLTRDPSYGLRVLLGPWTVYDKTTIAAAR